MELGTVEYPSAILAITSITMRDGAFVVHAEGSGPTEAWCGPVRVIGPDGVLVQYGGTFEIPAADAGQAIKFEGVLTPESPISSDMEVPK